jgi:hypothetical protein
MRASTDAAILVRTLWPLWRTRASGVLQVSSHGRHCDFVVASGVMRAARSYGIGVPTSDAQVADRALPHANLTLDARDLPTPPDAHATLTTQLGAVLRWRSLRCEFVRTEPKRSADRCEVDFNMPELLLMAAGAAQRDWIASEWLRANGSTRLASTALGRAWLAELTLFARGSALREALDAGATVDQLANICAGSERELRGLAALSFCEALVPRAQLNPSYSLLLRKRRQVQQRVSAAQLLDIEAGADPRTARQALRRLAGRLHPDALGPSTPIALKEMSTEMMRALACAEDSLRPRTAPRSARPRYI